MIELIVVLVILGLMAGVAGLAFGTARAVWSTDEISARVTDARQRAIRQRRPVTIGVRTAERRYSVTALPDGRIIADPALDIERLTGRRADAK